MEKVNSKYVWLFDNGHGGIINNVYQTAGKRSPMWNDGKILYEGEFNRSIVNRLMKLCTDSGIECVNLVDTQKDISLGARVRKANEINKNTDKNCIYISIHANGFNKESANGWGVFTSKGNTSSDKIAALLLSNATKEFPNAKMRGQKEANFYVLRNTSMSAILSENFFMTNFDECHNYLLSEDGRDRIAKIHFEMIQEMESSK
tara:strand:- start:606 stop:1217 length:612 start_codon:yes stop_codon:yes gene_type:complete